MSLEGVSQEDIDQVNTYREGVKYALVTSMEGIEKPFEDVDGKDFINAEVVMMIGSVLSQKGVAAAMKSALTNDENANGLLEAYSEVVTILDVLMCIVKGVPVVDG